MPFLRSESGPLEGQSLPQPEETLHFLPALTASDEIPAKVNPTFAKGRKRGLIVLNAPLPSLSFLRKLWDSLSVVLCADGGANRVYELTSGAGLARDYLPSSIVGDLDSVEPHVLGFYKAENVRIVHDSSDSSTDFAKTLRELTEVSWPYNSDVNSPSTGKTNIPINYEVFVVGSLSGRLDQSLGLFHETYKAYLDDKARRLWLFTDKCLSFILPPGRNVVSPVCNEQAAQNPAAPFTHQVGIIPLFGPAHITTTGLRWNVTNWKTEMGHQVSTSNQVAEEEEEVTVVTDHPVLFTMELKM